MKISGLLIMLTLVFSNLHGQSNKEEVEYIQSLFGMEKKAMVADFVKLDNATKDSFWNLYDEYETARKELGKKRIELLVRYDDNFENLSNEVAGDLLTEILSLTKKNDQLLASYVKKIRKATGPVTAMQFHQIEMYILSEIRVSIASSLPYPEIKQ